MLLEFVQIAGAVFLEAVAAQPRAECQMRRRFAAFDLGAFGNLDLEGGVGFARAFQPRHNLGADHFQALGVQRAGLAQPDQQACARRQGPPAPGLPAFRRIFP